MSFFYPQARRNLQRSYTAQVAAGGTATVEIVPTSAWAWSVTQVSVELANAPAGALCSLRLDGAFVSAIIPAGDVAAGEPPVLVQPGQVLAVTWTGCTPGSIGSVLVFYDELADR